MLKTIYTPFTYLIGWSHLDRWYYGVRYARGCSPEDLWTKYFTSSGVVKEYREKFGEPDIIEVRQIFNDSLQAREWEIKVLRRIGVIKNEIWLNKSDRASPPITIGPRTDEVKLKISQTLKGHTFSEEARQKMRNSKLGKPSFNKDKPKSEEHKRKLSKSLKGKPKSEEHRRKISETLKSKNKKV